jgi:hypothetical protein
VRVNVCACECECMRVFTCAMICVSVHEMPSVAHFTHTTLLTHSYPLHTNQIHTHSLHTTHHTPLTTHHSLHTTHYTPLTTHHSLHTTHYTPLTTHHSLHTTYPFPCFRAMSMGVSPALFCTLKCCALPSPLLTTLRTRSALPVGARVCG